MGKAVVLLEDDHLVRYALKTCLEESGYAVIDGPSVEAVADELSRKATLSPFHLCAVVADYRLDHSETDTDGIAAIHRLEKVCGNGWRPVLITGDPAPDIAAHARSAGVTLLRKPFGFDDLLAAIEPGSSVLGASATIGEPAERHFDLHAYARTLDIVRRGYRGDKARNIKVLRFSSVFYRAPTRIVLRRETLNKWRKHRAQLEELVRRRTAELVAANQELAALCMTDSLTGLANRRHFDKVIEVEWRRAIRQAQPIAIVMMDVDNFKIINDQHGHLVGDDCLRRIALVLADHAKRGGDFAARYGGDEFVIILPSFDHGLATAWAEKVRGDIIEHARPIELSEFGPVTVSVGVASMTPKKSDETVALIAAADRDLYNYKQRVHIDCDVQHSSIDLMTQWSVLR